MKAKDIRIGGIYAMRVSCEVVPVKVNAIQDRYDGKGNLRGKTYHCTSMKTGRGCKAESAAKFRREWAAVDEGAVRSMLDRAISSLPAPGRPD